MIRILPLLFMCTAFLLGCSLFSDSDDHKLVINAKFLKSKGLILLDSRDQIVKLGSEGELSAADEHPVTQAQFNYAFALGEHEVQRKDFVALMGYDPTPDHSTLADQDDSPIVNITWWDAILFCNAKSKLDKLDTVYTYTEQLIDSSFSTISLANFKSNFKANGYRLPTESEWEFAARAGIDTDFPWDTSLVSEYAWYLSNSSDQLHSTCTKQKNSLGFCDLAGSVMEWVHDWKGIRSESTLLNYLGSDQPDLLNSRPIKGGSYRHAMRYLRPSSRSDVYSVTTTTHTDYIGFRLAWGVMDTISMSTPQGKISTLPAYTFHNFNVIGYGVLGTNQAKLVFTSEDYEKLIMEDVNLSYNRIASHSKSAPYRHPMISPNGQWIAFSSRGEGQSGSSKVSVIRFDQNIDTTLYIMPDSSAAIPRWEVDSVQLDTFLIYVTDAGSNSDSTSWSLKSTKKISFNNKVWGTPTIITSQGAFHGGMSSRYLATGSTIMRTMDLQGMSTQDYFSSPQNGKDSLGSIQVCNVSISKSNELLFLDFGYPRVSSLVGRSYGIHEILFTANASTGEVTRFINPPAPWLGWNHPEWVTNSNRHVIATTFDQTEQSRAIWAVDLSTQNSVPIVSGYPLAEPHLWVPTSRISTSLSADSLGKYDYPHSSEEAMTYSLKTNQFLRIAELFKIVVLGSSRAMNGIASTVFSLQPSFNYGYTGAALFEQIKLIRSYVLNHANQAKVIVIGLDPDLMAKPDSVYNKVIAQNWGHIYDKNHNYWTGLYDSSFVQSMHAVTLPAISAHVNLYGELIYEPEDQIGYNAPPLLAPTSYWSDYPDQWKSSIQELRALLIETRSLPIQVVGIVFPQQPEYRDSEYWGRCGASRELGHEILDSLNQIDIEFEKFRIQDFNLDGLHDFTTQEALNSDHLNKAGAIKLTRRLDSLFNSWGFYQETP